MANFAKKTSVSQRALLGMDQSQREVCLAMPARSMLVGPTPEPVTALPAGAVRRSNKWIGSVVNTKRLPEHPQREYRSFQFFIKEAAHENEPRLAVPSCHGRR